MATFAEEPQVSEVVKPAEPEKAHCPTCNRPQNCDLHGRTYKPWEWSDGSGNSTSGGHTYSLFECRGCNTVFLEINSWDENDRDYWYAENGDTQSQPNDNKSTYPKPPSRPRPDWFDNIGQIEPKLFRILDEAYKAYEQNCYVLTAIGLRTALDSCVTAVKIDPAMTFSEKLETLLKGGWIGESEHALLTMLTDAGNAAAHQGWAPDEEAVRHLLDMLENFIQRNLVNGQRALAMKDGIPQKQRRKKGMPKRRPEPDTLAGTVKD